MEKILKQIDFYILANNDYQSFACRLLEKIYQEKLQAFVYVEDHAKAKELNDLLWTFRDISFVPHRALDETENISAPIFINYLQPEPDEISHYDILLVLAPVLPDQCEEFSRLILIVPENDHWKNAARNFYKQLTQQGYQINTHKIG